VSAAAKAVDAELRNLAGFALQVGDLFLSRCCRIVELDSRLMKPSPAYAPDQGPKTRTQKHAVDTGDDSSWSTTASAAANSDTGESARQEADRASYEGARETTAARDRN
jgi:hypothetical protein